MPIGLNWAGTIHHGLPPGLCPYSAASDGYLVFLGRIAPEKRPDRAIEIAVRAGLPLKIAAKVDPTDEKYFAEVIEPMLKHPLVEFVGEVNDTAKARLLGKAMAVLFPIDWPEPFGLVMIEAMSAGTPVICWRAGSVPEIVEHGISGIIVDSIEEAVAAVEKVGNLSREGVREAFERRFTAERMARNYVAAYHSVLSGSRSLKPPFRNQSMTLPREEQLGGGPKGATLLD